MNVRPQHWFMRTAAIPVVGLLVVAGLVSRISNGLLEAMNSLVEAAKVRSRRDEELKVRIKEIWTGSRETCGRPRVHAALAAEGERVSLKRVARLMRELAIRGATRRRFRTGTTKRDSDAAPARDLVIRGFLAQGPRTALGRTFRSCWTRCAESAAIVSSRRQSAGRAGHRGTRPWFIRTAAIPVVGLLVATGLVSDARPTLAQSQGNCVLSEGVAPPKDPPVTAQQVEDGSASLTDFSVAVKSYFLSESLTTEQGYHLGCLIRQEGSPWRSGSTYLVELTADGRVWLHAKDMSLSGMLLNPLVYGAIVQAVGIDPSDLADPVSAASAFADAAAGDGVLFDVPNIPGASGYANVYIHGSGNPIVLLAGFDLTSSHLVEEDIDYGDPTITARDVVDRETLKGFVTQAGEWALELVRTGDLVAISKARVALRDPNGPWRHGSVYLYVLDRTTNLLLVHGGFPNRHELRPLIPTLHDAVTGELIAPQLIAAATSGPEGGFVLYHFDDPADDTDDADILKVGYAREFSGQVTAPDGTVVPINLIVGSGIY